MKVAIVGAGPAGIAAARVLVAHGVAPVVIDEAQRPGGQIYRQPRPGLQLDIEGLLGAEAENYQRTHAAFDALPHSPTSIPPDGAGTAVSGSDHRAPIRNMIVITSPKNSQP